MFMQRQTASPSSLNNLLEQTGHAVGNVITTSSPVLNSAIDLMMYGITSPARSTKTVSPIIKSFSFITSSLNNEIDPTVTPLICTGSILATGVIEPVLPTWYSTARSLLVACRALNLNAIAHRG